MKQSSTQAAVLTYAHTHMHWATASALAKKEAFGRGALPVLCQAMATHRGVATVQVEGCAAVKALVFKNGKLSPPNSKACLCRVGTAPPLTQSSACPFASAPALEAASQTGAIEAVVEAMRAHDGDVAVVEAAVATLCVLCARTGTAVAPPIVTRRGKPHTTSTSTDANVTATKALDKGIAASCIAKHSKHSKIVKQQGLMLNALLS